MFDVVERLAQMREIEDYLRLYALVDGAQYESHRGQRLTSAAGYYSLFDGTPDEPLAHAGPWLIDTEIAGSDCIADLASLESEPPAVSWLIASQDLRGLAQLLQLNLDMRLPDGRVALLRFWDPRVLASLAEVLTSEQRQGFFGHVHEWHLLHDGRRVWIGRRRDNA